MKTSPGKNSGEREESSRSYQERTDIKSKDIVDNLHRCYKTPLKRKVITSNKINENIKTTDPKVMMD